MPVKRINDMIKTGQFGDVKFKEMFVFLRELGFEEKGGSKHLKMERKEKGHFRTKTMMIPRQKKIRPDQVRYLLKQLEDIRVLRKILFGS